MSRIFVDTSELECFFATVDKAAKGGFRKDLELFLEGIGEEFLRILLLLNSFERGADGNVFEISEGGLTLEVGTSVNYASYVNDGHWTNPKGVAMRFVPGDVELDSDGKIVKFTYNPGANTGMTLKQHWVEGAHYWESALRILDRIFPELLDRKLQQWMDAYFGG